MKRPSLAKHLLAWTLGALMLVWGSFIWVGYKTGEHEADELTDGHLASATALLLASIDGELAHDKKISVSPGVAELKAHDYQQSMSVVVWDASGRVLTHMGDSPVPEFSRQQGFATLRLGEPPVGWRAFSRWNDAGTRRIMVLLSERERHDLAEDIAEQVSQPGLWLFPVVALVLGLAVWRGLEPLHRLTQQVHALDIRRPQPLAGRERYAELHAIAEAIQQLAQRSNVVLARERALADEFAHELRTPLASLALQVRALREMAGEKADAGLVQMERDIHRADEVMSQLLALARASRTELGEAAQPLDLHTLAREVVADFVPQAYQGGHELALTGGGPFQITGHAVLLALALRNLIENALAHTPPGTEVQIELDPKEGWIQVSDKPASAVMTQSGRSGRRAIGLGLGLGHRVVEKVAEIHGATFEQRAAGTTGGHCYRIRFAPGRDPATRGATDLRNPR